MRPIANFTLHALLAAALTAFAATSAAAGSITIGGIRWVASGELVEHQVGPTIGDPFEHGPLLFRRGIPQRQLP